VQYPLKLLGGFVGFEPTTSEQATRTESGLMAYPLSHRAPIDLFYAFGFLEAGSSGRCYNVSVILHKKLV